MDGERVKMGSDLVEDPGWRMSTCSTWGQGTGLKKVGKGLGTHIRSGGSYVNFASASRTF